MLTLCVALRHFQSTRPRPLVKLLIRLLVFCRYTMLNRQLREIKRSVLDLPVTAQRAVGHLVMSEIEAAAKTPVPHLYGSSSTDVHQP